MLGSLSPLPRKECAAHRRLLPTPGSEQREAVGAGVWRQAAGSFLQQRPARSPHRKGKRCLPSAWSAERRRAHVTPQPRTPLAASALALRVTRFPSRGAPRRPGRAPRRSQADSRLPGASTPRVRATHIRSSRRNFADPALQRVQTAHSNEAKLLPAALKISPANCFSRPPPHNLEKGPGSRICEVASFLSPSPASLRGDPAALAAADPGGAVGGGEDLEALPSPRAG